MNSVFCGVFTTLIIHILRSISWHKWSSICFNMVFILENWKLLYLKKNNILKDFVSISYDIQLLLSLASLVTRMLHYLFHMISKYTGCTGVVNSDQIHLMGHWQTATESIYLFNHYTGDLMSKIILLQRTAWWRKA